MKLELLISSVNKDARSLVDTMKINSDAVIVNQCDAYSFDEFEKNGNKVRVFNMKEKGVGLSRNTALMRAEGDILLFSDEDIVYDEDYKDKVLSAFKDNPKADMLMFNIRVIESRRTYYINKPGPVKVHNCGRYPTYSVAIKKDELIKKGVTFSLLFGGGAKYSAGEDSLFILNCIKKGLKAYAVPVEIGEEVERPSTWFNGYTEKFFYDRGVLYHHLYGKLADLMALRFIIRKKSFMCENVPADKALGLMKKGIKDAR